MGAPLRTPCTAALLLVAVTACKSGGQAAAQAEGTTGAGTTAGAPDGALESDGGSEEAGDAAGEAGDASGGGPMGDGSADVSRTDAAVGAWSCGTAAGVCTCVEVGVDLGDATRPCAPSDCCFVDGAGRCTCRGPGAGLDCAALTASLHGQRTVDSCPPVP